MRTVCMRTCAVLCVCALLLCTVCAAPVYAAYENTHRNTGDQRVDLVAVARTQIGYHEGQGAGYENDQKYSRYFGVERIAWCGYFVAWCARQANIPAAILPTSGFASGFNTCGPVHARGDGYIPLPGDLALFYSSVNSPTHVGIVERYDTATRRVWVIDGNWSDRVSHHAEPIDGPTDLVGFVVPRYTTGISKLTALDVVAPVELEKGQSFSIRGLICSPNTLTGVTVSVTDASGSAVISRSASPNVCAYDIAELDNDIRFGTLAPGRYTFEITAVDASSREIWRFPFTVKGQGPTLSGALLPGDFEAGQPPTLQGILQADEPISRVVLQVQNASSRVELRGSAHADGMRCDLSKAQLPLRLLGAGTYTLTVTVTAGDRTERFERAFTVTGSHGCDRGDVTLDGSVDIEDAVALYRYASGLTTLTTAQTAMAVEVGSMMRTAQHLYEYVAGSVDVY